MAMKTLIRLLPVLLLTGALAQITTNAPLDWTRANELIKRRLQGETLTTEERAYLTRAVIEREQQNKPAAAAPVRTGKPLTQFGAGEKYKGEEGGLYGAGKNTPPAELFVAAKTATGKIQPLDATGQPAKDGRVGLVAVGMSNTTMEFSRFMTIANADPEKSPSVVLVDGAQAGRDAHAWVENEEPWSKLDERLSATGITPTQVQVVWIKQALASPTRYGAFPAHARKLQTALELTINRLKARYPNLQMVYLSSRIYAGYASTTLNPEPYAYEGAFAVRWVIQNQPPPGPVVLWGPYLWGDGAAWRRDDFRDDGTHPSKTGCEKVAQQLLLFFKTDELARLWFTK